jgi:caa(3)-type oxidase subunit IV
MSGESLHHPGPRQYVQVAILLAILTTVEVALFYLDKDLDMGGWDGPLLIVLSTMKLVIVVGWFMHLRFEKGLLSRFFSVGAGLAMGLYAIVLGTLGVLIVRG